jgi:hypothetical protein
MVLMSINDPSETAKNLAEITDVQGTEDRGATPPPPLEPNLLADTDPCDPPSIPALALRSDGRLLLSVAHLHGADLTGRETWTGIVLSAADARDAAEHLSDAADETGSHIAGRILWNGTKPDDDPGEGSHE